MTSGISIPCSRIKMNLSIVSFQRDSDISADLTNTFPIISDEKNRLARNNFILEWNLLCKISNFSVWYSNSCNLTFFVLHFPREQTFQSTHDSPYEKYAQTNKRTTIFSWQCVTQPNATSIRSKFCLSLKKKKHSNATVWVTICYSFRLNAFNYVRKMNCQMNWMTFCSFSTSIKKISLLCSHETRTN